MFENRSARHAQAGASVRRPSLQTDARAALTRFVTVGTADVSSC